MRRNRFALAALAAAAAFLAACGATGTPVDPAPVQTVARPVPVGVKENPTQTSGSAAPAPPPCNPRASFRPGPLPPAGQMPAGTPMRAIQDRGRLIAGVDQNTFLFGFRNPSTNSLEGFDIDRVREVALAIFGGDPARIDEKIQYKVISSAEREPELINGGVDIVVRTMTANCDRWQRISFSRIYYVAGQRLLVDNASPVNTIDQLGGKKVCAALGSTSIRFLSEHPAKPVPVGTDTWSDCLVMLQQHQVDAVSTDDTILSGLAAQDPNVKLAGERLTEEPYGIGISQQNRDLVRFVNGVLDKSVRDGAWGQSYLQWLDQEGSPPPAEYQD